MTSSRPGGGDLPGVAPWAELVQRAASGKIVADEAPAGDGDLAHHLRGRRLEPVTSSGPVFRARLMEDPAVGPVGMVLAQPAAPADTDRVQAETERLRWAAGRIPVPEVFAAGRFTVGHRPWSVLVRSIPQGRPASDPAAHRDALAAISVVAEAMAAVHALPVEDCPFDASTGARLASATVRVTGAEIDEHQLSAPYRSLGADRLLVELRRSLGALVDDARDRSVIHGDPRLENILVEGGRFVGWRSLGRAGVGDRYLDLAVVAASLAHHVSPHALGPFFEAYGLDRPSLIKMDAFALLAELS